MEITELEYRIVLEMRKSKEAKQIVEDFIRGANEPPTSCADQTDPLPR